MELKVSATSNPAKLAGAIVGFIEEGHEVELIGVGAGAVNQAVKSLIVARGYLATKNKELSCIPSFTLAETETGEKTAIKIGIKVN